MSEEPKITLPREVIQAGIKALENYRGWSMDGHVQVIFEAMKRAELAKPVPILKSCCPE